MTKVFSSADELFAADPDLGTTGWIEVGQDRIDRFADATDDHQWIHVDPGRAREGHRGRDRPGSPSSSHRRRSA